ncbi:TPA: hypothetical protein PTW06_003594 [Clostridium botulinum]|nr:hypothetical protein [Clostridium botulinum]HDK7226265.1 hypothetical protein [Clostridium botulinum]HDK7273655.1 hypothetical protein [Clostridium botulinum]HDK7307003.1 hypothetical protein [Clostridium botulinum]
MLNCDTLNLHGIIGSKQQTVEERTFGLVEYLGINTGTVYEFDKNTALSNRSTIHVDNAGNWGKFKVTYFDGTTIDSPNVIERVSHSSGIFSTGDMFLYIYSIPSDSSNARVDFMDTDGKLITTKVLTAYPAWIFSVVEDRENKRVIISSTDNYYNGNCKMYIFSNLNNNINLLKTYEGKNNVSSVFFPFFTGETKIKDGYIYTRTPRISTTECMFIKYDYMNHKTIVTMPIKNNDFVCVSTKMNLIYIVGEGKIYNFNLTIYSHNVIDMYFLVNEESESNYKLHWVTCQNPNGENDDLILVNGQGALLCLRLEPTKKGTNKVKVVGSFSGTNVRGWDSDMPNKNSKVSTKGDALLGVWYEAGLIRR